MNLVREFYQRCIRITFVAVTLLLLFNAKPRPDFRSCRQFEGARIGYVFKTGPRGIGYYRDVR